jgi:hypothetical protein
MDSIHVANVFNTYRQEENNFTNGLFSLLRISAYERPHFLASFLKDLLGITPQGSIDTEFRVCVLRKIELADAELRCGTCCLRFETKIVSGAIRHDQVQRHLRHLKRCSGRFKRVVLLTPDDSDSQYIRQFRKKYNPSVLHLGWKPVHDYLGKSVKNSKKSVFSELVRQFLEQIHECVFTQDYAGVITKIAFGDHAEVYPTTTEDHYSYLEEMRRGWWNCWNTPRPYKELEGTGRKLLLYDRERGGITAEVEIKRVQHIRWERAFPSRNVFATKPKVFRKPILLKQIRSIPGFENFGKYRKDRTAYRNITREQYRQLMELRSNQR